MSSHEAVNVINQALTAFKQREALPEISLQIELLGTLTDSTIPELQTHLSGLASSDLEGMLALFQDIENDSLRNQLFLCFYCLIASSVMNTTPASTMTEYHAKVRNFAQQKKISPQMLNTLAETYFGDLAFWNELLT